MELKKSLLISNILDPLTKNDDDLIQMYEKLFKENRYCGVETRVITNDLVRRVFNKCANEVNWDVTIWLTGDMSRKNLNLSSLNEDLRLYSVNETLKLLDLASMMKCNRVGVASGIIEDVCKVRNQVNQFSKSLSSIFRYIIENEFSFDVITEPLDGFAHKKNVIGKTSDVIRLIDILNQKEWFIEGRYTLCWDSAHIALNNEGFKESLIKLSPYISRIHFADAIIDEKHKEFGDNHRAFDGEGIMSLEVAKQILKDIKEVSSKSFMYVACEVRTDEKTKSWENERIYYDFLEDAFKEVL